MNRDARNGLIFVGGVGALASLVIFSNNAPNTPRENNPLPVPAHTDSEEQRAQTPLELEKSLMKSYDGQPIREENRDDTLSNGMRVANYPMGGVIETDWGKVYIMNTGYGSPEYDMRVFDLEDGKPFVFTKVNKKGEFGEELWDSEKGEFVLDHLEKRFDLTYRFCNEPHGPFRDGTYPIWDPTAFRSDPCYGFIGPIKREDDE